MIIRQLTNGTFVYNYNMYGKYGKHGKFDKSYVFNIKLHQIDAIFIK